MKKQLLFRRFPAVLLALLTVLMLALLPKLGEGTAACLRRYDNPADGRR